MDTAAAGRAAPAYRELPATAAVRHRRARTGVVCHEGGDAGCGAYHAVGEGRPRADAVHAEHAGRQCTKVHWRRRTCQHLGQRCRKLCRDFRQRHGTWHERSRAGQPFRPQDGGRSWLRTDELQRHRRKIPQDEPAVQRLPDRGGERGGQGLAILLPSAQGHQAYHFATDDS